MLHNKITYCPKLLSKSPRNRSRALPQWKCSTQTLATHWVGCPGQNKKLFSNHQLTAKGSVAYIVGLAPWDLGFQKESVGGLEALAGLSGGEEEG